MSVLRKGAVLLGAGLAVGALAGCSASTPSGLAEISSATSIAVEANANLVPPPATAGAGHSTAVAAPPRVKTPPPSPVCANNPAGVDHIYVNIAQQHLWACSGGFLFTDTAVTTGAYKLTNVHDATPTGTWRIYAKMRNVYLNGHDANGSWHDHVAYWVPFDGPYGFHDASWQTFPYGSSLYATKGSHGCVHVPVAVLAKIYSWAPIGTRVTIVSH
jgi:hypothetical protein